MKPQNIQLAKIVEQAVIKAKSEGVYPTDLVHAIAEAFDIEVMEMAWDCETAKSWPEEVWED